MVTLSLLPAAPAVAVTQTMPLLAKLVRAIEITLGASLDFGTLAMTAERGGAATIDPYANKLTVAGNSSLTAAGGEPRAGRIHIKGSTMPITVSVEKTAVQLTNGVSVVTVNDFNFQTAKGGPKVTVTPTASDELFVVYIGATINTKPGQLTGSYVGSNRVFVNFQ